PAVVIGSVLLCSLSILVLLWKSPVAFSQFGTWSLRAYMCVVLLAAVGMFSIVGAVWETRTFTNKSLETKIKSEQAIAGLFGSSIREPVLQRSLVEATRRAKQAMDLNKDICVGLEISGETVLNCDNWLKSKPTFNQIAGTILFEPTAKTVAARYNLYFDHS